MDRTSLIHFLWTALPVLRPTLNRFAINGFAGTTQPRPRPFSLWSPEPKPAGDAPGPITDYTSWPALTDRTFSGRHLGPALPAEIDALPKDAPFDPMQRKWGEVTSLFARPPGSTKLDRSSVLFMFFAQWFTDSVLRTDPADRRKNTSNHDIDLCQIYGLNEKQTRLLRALAGGKLKSQQLPGGEYPCYLHESHGSGYRIKQEFAGLITEPQVDKALQGFPASRREKFYATGLERGNSSIGYVSISTLFLREHNRICDELSRQNNWDDERLFQTARAINIVLLMRILVEDYINHINGYPLFKLDPSFAERHKWYRPNWIALEFDLLYRWHSLVPDELRLDG
jgi:prostaglandin-endoperoxide synthase 2